MADDAATAGEGQPEQERGDAARRGKVTLDATTIGTWVVCLLFTWWGLGLVRAGTERLRVVFDALTWWPSAEATMTSGTVRFETEETVTDGAVAPGTHAYRVDRGVLYSKVTRRSYFPVYTYEFEADGERHRLDNGAPWNHAFFYGYDRRVVEDALKERPAGPGSRSATTRATRRSTCSAWASSPGSWRCSRSWPAASWCAGCWSCSATCSSRTTARTTSRPPTTSSGAPTPATRPPRRRRRSGSASREAVELPRAGVDPVGARADDTACRLPARTALPI